MKELPKGMLKRRIQLEKGIQAVLNGEVGLDFRYQALGRPQGDGTGKTLEGSEGDSHRVIQGKNILGRSNTKHRGPEAAASLPGVFKETVRHSRVCSNRSNEESNTR